MTKVAFHGCSFTQGEGFEPNDWLEFGYPSLVSNNYNWNHKNYGIPGGSNLRIFHSAVDSIVSNNYKTIFVQWSAVNRIWLSPGPNIWWFMNDTKYPDFRYRDLYINAKDQKLIKEKLLFLNHDYQNIIDLCTYCNVLEQLAIYNKVKLVFINGLLNWNRDLFFLPSNDLAESFSKYTKEIFDFDNRDDNELIQIHNNLFNHTKTLNQSLWVNIFNSIHHLRVDFAPVDNIHPGPKTQQIIYKKIINYLDSR
tara:strand:+ start:133 stop:888 length:756 start_codon:yes stop_codon:yes gene_type:complete